MAFPDLAPGLKKNMPKLRGRLLANQSLAELTWFRVGGPAQLLFIPEDETDLSHFLANLPLAVEGLALRAGAAVPDVKVARAAQDAGIAGLSFMRGIPGGIGGALRMNGGAYGRETKDALIEARAVDRHGFVHVLRNPDMHYTYRHCGAPEDYIFTQATFRGERGDPAVIAAEMEKITEAREATQPVKSRTGGSTFKNPPGHKAWQLIDAAGCRGLIVRGAPGSTLHCNFLIHLRNATAADIETLGETVRRRVKDYSGIDLEWEIKRIGVAC